MIAFHRATLIIIRKILIVNIKSELFLFYGIVPKRRTSNLDKTSIQYDAVRKRIFDLLKEQKITQKELAEKLDVPAQTITDWKKGKSNSFSGQYGRIAPVLHTTASWLAFGEGIKYIPDESREEILNQKRENLLLSLNRSSLVIAIDSLPDDKLYNLSGELIEMLTELSSEDMKLLQGIVRLMIARGKSLGADADSTDSPEVNR